MALAPRDTAEAREIQRRLRDRRIDRPPPGFQPRLVAGVDMSIRRGRDTGYAAAMVFVAPANADPAGGGADDAAPGAAGSPGAARAPAGEPAARASAGEPVARASTGEFVARASTGEPADQATAVGPVDFPYVPGLLSFRELPLVLEAWSRLETSPDVVIFDGHGLAHPRRFGLACHGGLLLDLPAVGCAKSLLVGDHGPLGTERGATAAIRHEGDVVGMAVRTRTDVRPVYVSVGHRMDLDTAVALVLSVARYRVPEPVRAADRLVGRLRREAEGAL